MIKVAWLVSSDEGAEIVFGKNEDDAKYSTDIGFDEIERAEDYDQYVTLGYVPASILLKNGWVWRCSRCERQVGDGYYLNEDGEEIEVTPIIYDRHLFCAKECEAEHNARQTERKQKKDHAIADLLSKYPNLERSDIKSTWIDSRTDAVIAEHVFGGRYRATWSTANPDVSTICFVDKEAFDKFKGGKHHD